MNDKWMKDLRDLGRAYERKAPDGLLDDIRREMSARGLVPAPHKAAAVRPYLWQRMAVAAGIAALIGTGTVAYLSWDGDTRPLTAGLSAPPSRPSGAAASADALLPPDGQDATPLPARVRQSDTETPRHHDTRLLTDGTDRAAHATETAATANEAPTPQPAIPTDEPPTPPSDPNPAAGPIHGRPGGRPTPPPSSHNATPVAPAGRTSHHEWQVSAYYAGTPNSLPPTPSEGGDMAVMVSAPYFDAQAERVASAYPTLLMANMPPIRHERHYRPVKVGLSVSLPLAGRWSLQAALTYSRLTSEITQETPLSVMQTTQKLHYLGIPVSLSYHLWQHGHLSLYAKAGAGIEQLVSGKAVSRYTEGTILPPPTETRLSEHRPVLSTHVAMGAAYRPLPALSLFAEPGAEYHFNNGSGLHSSYTDRPLNFSLSLGMRLYIR